MEPVISRPAEAQLHHALDAMDQGFLWLDADLVVRQHNRAYLRLLELDPDGSFLGRPYAELLSFLHQRGEFMDRDATEDFLSRRLAAMHHGQPYRQERVRPNGTVLSIAAVPLESGGYVYTYLDISAAARARDEVQRAAKATVVAMANFAEHRDTDTGAHVLRVARLAGQIARELQEMGQFAGDIDEDFIAHIRTASVLHDVGKISTPDSVLLKPGALTAPERQTMMDHAAMGAHMLRQAQLLIGESSYLHFGMQIAMNHHEWYDGSGYPNGLAGNDIPLAARICAIADVFDALTSRRPYKAPWSTERAEAWVRQHRGVQFDPVVTDAFLSVLRKRAAVSLVQWNDAMSVGNPHIDEQHMILLDTINQLAHADSENDPAGIGMVIDELVAYASFHFYYEERLMAEAGYTVLAQHKRQHQRFSNWITNVRDEFNRHQRRRFSPRILNFLRDWLRIHIMEDDHRFRDFVAGKTAASSPHLPAA